MADAVRAEEAPVAPLAQVAPEQQESGTATEEKASKEDEPTEASTDNKEEKVNAKVEESADGPKGMLKTTRQHDEENRRNNVKYDASSLEKTDDPKQIRAQVEFYFGDSNLPTDKFMWDTTGGSENKPVSLKTIANFKRMRRFQPYTAVVAALKESNFLTVEGEEGEETVRRKNPYVSGYVSEYQKKRTARSVYVKGFGDEDRDTQFKLEAFFQKFGPVEAVRLRRTDEKLFKGSVFVEFPTEEAAKEFLNLDPKPTWEGHELKIMSKKAYCEEKNKLIKDGKLQPSSSPHNNFFEGNVKNGNNRGGRGGRGDRGGRGHFGGDRGGLKKHRDGDNKGRDLRHDNWRGRDRGGNRGRDRGRGRNDRGRNDRGRSDRNKEAREEKEGPAVDVAAVSVQEADKAAAAAEKPQDAPNGTKRAREEAAGEGGAPPAKKVDIKAEVTAES